MGAGPGAEYAALQRLDAWDGLARLNSLLDDLKRRPNFFLIAPRVLRVEGVHSDMLAWLLDPQGWHGLDDRFARGFVLAVLAECGRSAELPLTVDEIHREFSTGKGPVDILIRVRNGDKRLVLGVENKIDSPEGDDQLNRYGDGLAIRFRGDEVVIAFLTPDGREPKTWPPCSVACLAYRTVASVLEEAIGATPASTVDPAGLALARHYLAALRTHVMPDPHSDIDSICRKLYEEHQEAWRAIRRRLPSKRDESHAYIGSKVCQRLEETHRGKWLSSVRRDKYACVFRPAWFDLGFWESDPIIGLSQPAETHGKYARVHFRLVVERSDTDLGERFHYRVRLKVDTAKNPALGKSLVRALKALGSMRSRMPARTQFTVPLKSTSRLPAMGDEPESVPDSVVDWFAGQVADLVPAIDSVFRKA